MASNGGGDASLLDSTPLVNTKQQIHLSGEDACDSCPVYGRDVQIVSSDNSAIDVNTPGSSKVKITPVVNYDWEHKYYIGNLIAVSSNYVAYMLLITSGYGVRILNRKTSTRALIKGFTGVVSDLAFAHTSSNVLACIDKLGNLTVYELQDVNDKLEFELKVNLTQDGNNISSDFHRVVWCPYIPEAPSETGSTVSNEEGGRILAVTHDNIAEVWDIDLIAEKFGKEPKPVSDVTEGVIRVLDGHSKPISDIAIAPDASVLATASADGSVKFWQIYWEGNDPPRRLHQWVPHNGKAISTILFCDNHKFQDPNVHFWRFLITGANQNSELKIWCTVTWTCLQTVVFSSPTPQPYPSLKAKLDLTASYIIMSDIKRKVLYILQIYQNAEVGTAHISSISEFLLTQPMLSFFVVDASQKKFKHTAEYDNNDETYLSGEIESSIGTVVKMFCVHTKSLQEFQVRFQPQSSVVQSVSGSISTLSQDDIALQDGLSDMSFMDQSIDADISQGEIETQAPLDGDHHLTPSNSATASFTSESTRSSSQPVLMTPQDFMKGPRQQSYDGISAVGESVSSTSSFTQVTAMNSSVDELLISRSSSDNTRIMTPESSLTMTPSSLHPTPESASLLTPSSLPLPLSPADYDGTPVSSRSGGGGKSRLLEKRLSDSSAEVATILGQDIAPEEVMKDESTPTMHEKLDNKDDVADFAKPGTEDKDELSDTKENQEAEMKQASLDEFPPDDFESTVDEGQDSSAVHAQDNGGRDTSSDADVSSSSKDQTLLGRLKKEKRKHASPKVTVRRSLQIPEQPCIDLSSVTDGIKEISDRLDKQQEEILQLRKEMSRSQLSNSINQSLKSRIDKLEKGLGTRMESIFTKFSDTERQKMKLSQQEDKQKQDKLMDNISHTLRQSVTTKLDKTVKAEIQQNILPQIEKMVQPLGERLHETVSHKITATNDIMRENISKLVKSRSTTEAMGQAAANTLSNTIQSTYRDAFHTSILPAFERSCQNMLSQVNAAFESGTREYLQHVDSQMQDLRQKHVDAKDPVVAELKALVANFKESSAQLHIDTSSLIQEEIGAKLDQSLERMEKSMLSSIKEVVKEELTVALQDHSVTVQDSISAAIRSQTPLPQIDLQVTQTKIAQQLSQGHINEAFQTALSASDLRLVLFACKSFSPDDLFGQVPCPVDQPVILSLLQQLSHELDTDTDIKYSYLDECVLAIDPSNVLTREHLPGVVTGMCQRLSEFVEKNRSHNLRKPIRKLIMQAQAILK
ncbi:enhancer of mRNA-decapping protein 4-like isoform X2 [Anneissia japonica]|nr:enhancer of mRNA-decapping protein 4-like isoform X2 [Anneissia japonica]XP_033125274.1 enhancer of mRNA-decapping protein 4-like isoform X2 [Anneissia japonica]XP_033125275.1 enhancer of mRNA-decapping protein 4-like isoform X2 [Anneissia japonica]XP_033125276.1 enhancer of mRNA-decapping protein 4-like isoform X2 [Anneissia japonica]